MIQHAGMNDVPYFNLHLFSQDVQPSIFLCRHEGNGAKSTCTSPHFMVHSSGLLSVPNVNNLFLLQNIGTTCLTHKLI
jgi:hypothetical protein